MQRRGLSGQWECTLDDRNRLAIPAKVRDRYDGGVVIARWLDARCLILVPRLEWQDLLDGTLGRNPDPLDPDVRALSRYLHRWAHEQEALDRQGRVVVPGSLIAAAELSGTVAVIGAGKYLEVWDPAGLDAHMSPTEEGVSDLAQRVRASNAAPAASA